MRSEEAIPIVYPKFSLLVLDLNLIDRGRETELKFDQHIKNQPLHCQNKLSNDLITIVSFNTNLCHFDIIT